MNSIVADHKSKTLCDTHKLELKKVNLTQLGKQLSIENAKHKYLNSVESYISQNNTNISNILKI